MHRTTSEVRIIAQDQNGAALKEMTSRSTSHSIILAITKLVLVRSEVQVEGNCITIAAQRITFSAPNGTKFDPMQPKLIC